MPDTILQLHLEHGRVGKLLDLVDRQLTGMENLLPPNVPLLQLVLDYLSAYADECHHPKEDLVYRMLASRYPDRARSLGRLVQEHEQLGRMTEDLRRVSGTTMFQEHAGPTGEIAERLRDFTAFYRRHMSMEEQHFFPVALQSLTRNDWAEIDFAVFDQVDPLLDRNVEQRFAQLRDEIQRMEQAQTASAARLEETARLRSMQDIVAFNEAMRSSGETARLRRTSEGDYELERSGRMLVHIPDCDESCAAWSAYFYLKGCTQSSILPGQWDSAD